MSRSKISPIKQAGYAARRQLAAFWLNTVHHRTVQIGISGSYGKTSTTALITALLSAYDRTLVTDVNLDTIYNLPITALKLRGHRFAVLEMGIDRRDEMDFHLKIVQPDIAVMTGIAPVHADAEHLGSFENLIHEKRKLIEALRPEGIAVLNVDNAYVREMIPHTRGRVIRYGQAADADYRAEAIIVRADGTRFRAVTPKGTIDLETRSLGRHSAANLMGAVAVAAELGMPLAQIAAITKDLEPLTGRLNTEPGPLGTTLINDALRANTESTRAGLAFLSEVESAGRRVAVLGEMGEIGDRAVEEHEGIGAFLPTLNLDQALCIGGLTEHIVRGALEKGFPADRIANVETVQEAAALLRDSLQPGDILYLKGSLLRHLERVKLILRGVEVGCAVRSCPFYHQCDGCDYRVAGYAGGEGQ